MNNISNFDEFTNEKFNLKGLALGALSALAVSCGHMTVKDSSGNELPTEHYVNDGVVKKIGLTNGNQQQYVVKVEDFDGNIVTFFSGELTYGVGDSIHMDIDKGISYPLNDPDNISDGETDY